MPQDMQTTNKQASCTLYIVRHGETEWNVQRIIQGQTDSRLTEKGQKQAKILAERFRNIKFDAVFSSDLVRAQRTAEIISIEHSLAVKTVKVLRERKFGRFEGKKEEEFEREFKQVFDKINQLSQGERLKYKLADDIESDEQIVSRFITFLREIAVAYAGKTVLVVTHGGIIKHFLVHLGFAKREELPVGAIANTAYIKLRTDGVEFFVKETEGIKLSS